MSRLLGFLQGSAGDHSAVLNEYRRVHSEAYVIAMMRIQNHAGLLEQAGHDFFREPPYEGAETIGLNDEISFEDD